MKHQIAVLSPHQNGKVLGVLMAVASLVFVVPFMLFAALAMPPGPAPSAFLIVLGPVLYLVMSYITVFAVCIVYNYLYRWIGGLEFEARNVDA